MLAITERRRTIRLRLPVDLGLTLGPLRHGLGDPTIRLEAGQAWRATRTPDGAGTIRLRLVDSLTIECTAWGPGADWLLDAAPQLLGSLDDLAGFDPPDRVVRDLHRRLPGLRVGRTGAVLEALIPAIIEQKVTGSDARSAYRGLIRRYGESAPGPTPLRLAPDPRTLAGLPSYELHVIGLERRRAETLRRAASHASRLEEVAGLDLETGRRRLLAIAGIGPWTAAEVATRALGDPDAVSVGDYHLPNLVCWSLAGEPRGDDARMLQLLEPYRGHRGRVIRLLEAGGPGPPRYGPPVGSHSIQGM